MTLTFSVNVNGEYKGKIRSVRERKRKYEKSREWERKYTQQNEKNSEKKFNKTAVDSAKLTFKVDIEFS